MLKKKYGDMARKPELLRDRWYQSSQKIYRSQPQILEERGNCTHIAMSKSAQVIHWEFLGQETVKIKPRARNQVMQSHEREPEAISSTRSTSFSFCLSQEKYFHWPSQAHKTFRATTAQKHGRYPTLEVHKGQDFGGSSSAPRQNGIFTGT